ncbi:MAG: hypothetical protein ACJAU0_002673 [Flavobacteriales bacterium]|jgi:hypothetical protein
MKGFIICTLLHLGAFSCGYGQDQFEGKVVYLPVESQEISSTAKEQAPMKVVVRAKGSQVRWDEFTEKGSRSIITDFAVNEQFVLIEFLGTLCAIETPKEQCAITSEEITEGKKHGKMMDQKCLSISIDNNQIVWIPGMILKHPFLPNVNGIPTEFWHKTAQGKVLYRAISVIYETQSERFFTIPEEYAKVKADELSSLFNLTSQ